MASQNNNSIVAVLIGFSYRNTIHEFLPGITIDLFQMYSLVKKMEQQVKIVVITDLIEDENSQTVSEAVVAGLVSADILTFISTLKSRNEYYFVTDRTKLTTHLIDNLTDSKRTFIYYTGHVEKEQIILPTNQFEVTPIFTEKTDTLNLVHLPLYEFKNLLIKSIDSNGEACVIMDCCNGNGLKLPYKLKNSVYRLVNDQFISPKIICITSTHFFESSAATRNGSIFTRFFTRNIVNFELSLLTKKINDSCLSRHNQNASIHASYPNLKYLWPWVLGFSNIEINFDLKFVIYHKK
jgi:hypothetical protein